MYCNFFGYLCVHCHLSRANKRWVSSGYMSSSGTD